MTGAQGSVWGGGPVHEPETRRSAGIPGAEEGGLIDQQHLAGHTLLQALVLHEHGPRLGIEPDLLKRAPAGLSAQSEGKDLTGI
jgi:hypothetical protein